MVRQYSDDERTKALAAYKANANNLNRTSVQLGIPRNTLRRWVEGTSHPEAVANATLKKEPLADRLENLAHLLLDDMHEKDRRDGATFVRTCHDFWHCGGQDATFA